MLLILLLEYSTSLFSFQTEHPCDKRNGSEDKRLLPEDSGLRVTHIHQLVVLQLL